MGWLSWLFPSEEDRIKKAQKFLKRRDPASARVELEGLESAEANELRQEAEARLVELNIERARGDIAAGALDEAAVLIDLAARFAGRNARNELRSIRRELRQARSEEAKKKPRKAVGGAADPFGGGGFQVAKGGAAEVPMEEPGPGFKADPIFSLPPDDPRVRYALLLESYPEVLREKSLGLGVDYAGAVLALEDGNPGQAYEALSRFIGKDPVARFERARAAVELGKIPQATSDLRTFVDAYGHQQVGATHTAVLLSRLLAQEGRLDDALRTVEQARESEPRDLQLAGVQAGILEAMDRLEEADNLAVWLQRQAPRDMGIYRLLARIRLRADKRLEAMQALESGLAQTCTTPGRCTTEPLDVEAARLLARLYLEDRMESARAEELIGEIAMSGAPPDWTDDYLQALRARNNEDPGAETLVRGLQDGLPPNDPRRRILAELTRALVPRVAFGVAHGLQATLRIHHHDAA